MNTYTKEITFVTKVLGDNDKWEKQKVTKTATFKELDDTDKSQHRLHFQLLAIFQSFDTGKGSQGSEKTKAKIDPEGLYDITVLAVNTLLVFSEQFSEADKNELLNSSSAIMQLAFWLLAEKLTPFFQEFSLNSL